MNISALALTVILLCIPLLILVFKRRHTSQQDKIIAWSNREIGAAFTPAWQRILGWILLPAIGLISVAIIYQACLFLLFRA
jgi:hypothetical protein